MASKHPAISERDDEERTTVDPGGLDKWQDERTVADSPSPSTGTTDVRPSDDGESVVLVNRAPNGTESETVDELTIEEHKRSVAAPAMRSNGKDMTLPVAALMVRTGPHEGESFKLGKPLMTVGRALGNDIVLVDPSISKKHLQVEYDGSFFFLRDLGSGNGTVVNGRDEDHRYKLQNRDALELGRSIITFECAAMEVSAPTVAPPRPRAPTGKPTAKRASQKPRGRGKPTPEPPRATVSLRSEPALQAFDDVDDEASTIAGQRPPGPAQLPQSPMAARKRGASGSPRHREQGRELVMPRGPQGPNPRMTNQSPAVPAPRSEPPRAAISAPSLEVVMEDEEPTSAAPPPRRPPVTSRPPAARATVRAPVTARPPGPSRPPQPRGPMAAVVYPTAPQQFNRSGAVVALSPRGPNQVGLMREAPRHKGGRKWVAAIALLAVATIVGVTVAALSGGGGTSESENANAATKADAGSATTTTDPTKTDAGTTVAATDPTKTDAGTTVAATDPTKTDAGSATASATDPVPGADAGSATAATTDPATRTDAGSATVSATNPGPTIEPIRVAVLMPRDTWGTSEDVVVSLPQTPVVVEPETPIAADMVDDATKNDAEQKRRDEARLAREAAKKEAARDRDRDKDKDKDSDKAIAALIRSNKSRATAAYRDRNFARASSLLSSAASKAPRRTARKLRRTAGNYKEMGRLLSTAKSDANSNPIVAFNKYKRAKALDRKLGRKHQRFINARILTVGPRAATKYMTTKDYAKAARAVSLTRAAGDRARTARVMASLEKVAGGYISKGKKAKRAGNTNEAKGHFLKAKSVLPTQSPRYGEVAALLKSLR